MKFFVEFLVLFGFTVSSVPVSGIKYSTINGETVEELLELFKKIVGTELTLANYTLTSADKTFTGSVANATLQNPSDFVTNLAYADMDSLIFWAEITYPSLTIDGVYNMVLNDSLIGITGNGDFLVNITGDFTLTLNITLQLTSDETLEMNRTEMDYNFSNIKVNLDNLGDAESSNYLNEIINTYLLRCLIAVKEEVQIGFNLFIIQKSKFFLDGMTVEMLEDIIDELLPSSQTTQIY